MNGNHGGHTWAGKLEDPYGTGQGLFTLSLAFNATGHNRRWWSALANKFMKSDSVSLRIEGRDYGAIPLRGSARALKRIANLKACR